MPHVFNKLLFFSRSKGRKAEAAKAADEHAHTQPKLNGKETSAHQQADTENAATNSPLQLEESYRVSNASDAPLQSVDADGHDGFGKHVPESSLLDIYKEYFGLSARPFSLVPDPDFIFWSPAHKRAYTMLEYGVLTRAPITLVTGEVGSGKTTLLHYLLKNIDQRIRVALVANAQGSRGELLRWVLNALGESKPADMTYVDLFESFQSLLIEEYAKGGRVIIIFDEAQNLSRESLEELRMFTNINSNKDELLQLILMGQPELRDTIKRPDLRQFAQRVAANFHLGAMDSATVYEYIAHRLRAAGAQKNLFHRTASNLIHEQTGGVPRLVNQLCDLAMVYTFTNNQKIVTYRTVKQVLDDGAFFGAGAFGETESTV